MERPHPFEQARMRPRARAWREDDRAVAGAIGIILMLAVAVTAYAHAVRMNIPVYGEEAEREWDEYVSAAFQQMARSVAEGMETGSPVATTIPMPPAPRSIDIPFLGSAAPQSASGSVRFEGTCASATATHTLGSGQVVSDLQGGPTGCVAFHAEPVYSGAFGYRYELGGILRLQSGRAVVLAGPPLELDPTGPAEYRVSLSLPGLRGDAVTSSTDAADVHVDVVPGPAATEVEQAPNAAEITWTLETAYPSAWKTWFQTRFAQAGFVADRSAPLPGQSSGDYAVACDPVDCSIADGVGHVVITIEGPRTDAQDVKLSLTYGLADVNVR